MAQKTVQLDREKLSCSVCLDLLKEPVTIPCGHSYCMNCIQRCWIEEHDAYDEDDEEDEEDEQIHSCPQCRQSFIPRPVLVKNTMLAVLVEELEKTGLPAAPADHCYAGPEDVACDFCTGRKLKALKSCFICLASYCEQHLQPHYESPAFEKHKLVEPSKKLQENICSRHDEVMKILCLAAERTERERELGVSRQNIQQTIQDREKNLKLLQQEVKAITDSADQAVKDSEKMFTELIHLMKKRSSDVKQQVRSQLKAEVSRVKEFQEKLEQEISELKRKDAELEQLSHTEDHNQFLYSYSSVLPLSQSTHSASINIHPLHYFEDVTVAVSEARDKLQDVLRETLTNISLTVTNVDVLLLQPEPKTRAEFFKYSRDITLDPNTACRYFSLTRGYRKATLKRRRQTSFKHPDKFYSCQVLSRESLTGRCYWEVEWKKAGVSIAVAYKKISRGGRWLDYNFGCNKDSWALECVRNKYRFRHSEDNTDVSGPPSSRIGVYLDHSAGILSFYGVSQTMTLLHRIQTTFTEPLYVGLWLYVVGDTAKFCKLK